MRRLTWSWQPIRDAEHKAQVDKATFECRTCKTYIYKGASEKSLSELQTKYKNKTVVMGTIFKDHIEPVIPIGKKTKDLTLDEISDRMFCEEDGIQILCEICHNIKTNEEDSRR